MPAVLERCDHNRFADQLAQRIAPSINALVPTADSAVAITHNQPGRLDYAREALSELSAWLKDNPVIQDYAQAKTGSALKERTLVALNEARTERESKTSPIREKLNAIYATYELVKDKGALETVYNELRKRLTKYANAVEEARIAEANRLRAEAEERERLARAAEAAEQDAIACADVGECSDVAAAIVEADQKFSDFQRANRQAAIAEKNVPLRFGSVMGGKTQSMRTTEVLAIDDAAKAIRIMGLTPKITEAILSSARDYRKAHEELPAGISATFQRSL